MDWRMSYWAYVNDEDDWGLDGSKPGYGTSYSDGPFDTPEEARLALITLLTDKAALFAGLAKQANRLTPEELGA